MARAYIQDIELTGGGSGGEVAWDDITDKPNFAGVATSGDYEDLENKPDLNTKQDALVSGENIKTVNGQPLLGSGDIEIEGGNNLFIAIENQTPYADILAAINAKKQIVLLTNNNTTCEYVSSFVKDTSAIELHAISDKYDNTRRITLTEWRIRKSDDAWSYTYRRYFASLADVNAKQDTLVSGTNIKTINNESLLGSGNIEIEGGGAFIATQNVTTFNEVNEAISAGKEILLKGRTGLLVAPGISKDSDNIYFTIPVAFNLNNSPAFGNVVLDNNDVWSTATINLQERLVSGENIKTLNNESLLGSGNIDIPLGDLTTLTTEDQSNLVAALNEVYEKCGEPFRVKQWMSNTLNVEIPCCTEDISNTSIPKLTFTIDAEEGALYQIVGMIAYEVFDTDSGGSRINCWPVCQFTGNGQKELGVRFMCAGTSRKTAKRISAWVLLKRRA